MASPDLPFALTAKVRETLNTRHPDKIPVFVLRAPKTDPSFPHLPKSKFLVPRSITLGMFSYVVRKHMTLPPEKALFLFVNNSLETSSILMSELYARYRSDDGALRLIYTSESTFGV